MRQSDLPRDPDRLRHNHEANPVHLIGLTQPHGVLMALEATSFTIIQVSDNTESYLGIEPQTLLGQSLLELAEPTLALQHSLETCTEQPSYVSIALTANHSPFDALIHRRCSTIIVELESASPQTAPQLTALQNKVEQAIGRLRQIDDVTDFLQTTVTEIQALTGYERVMVYQFDNRQAGAVVAEIKPAEKTAYLGLHYPATDIPTPVRQLYQQGILRYIPDLSTPQCRLIPPEAVPLDLGRAVLRGVDSCCIDYHQNMEVSALMVIALVKGDTLWGLISCHHSTPRQLPYAVRSACEVIGQLVAAELTSKVDRDELSYLSSLQTLQADLVDSIAKAKNFKQALIEPAPRLLDVVSAQGAAICLDQDITLVGDTPALEEVQALINWAMAQSTDIFHTSCLSQDYPAAIHFRAVASGLVVLKISQIRRYLILWFRPEVLQTISWAGNPDEGTHETADGSLILSPRASFQEWQETVRATALPWKPAEIANALALKHAIVGIVLNKADELAQINLELERSNRELDSFAYAASHDLKEPLRGIPHFSNIILRRHSHNLDESAIKRLRTLVKLAERMDGLIDALLRFSRLGQTDLQLQPTDLNELLTDVLTGLRASSDDSAPPIQVLVPRALPTVNADPALLSEVFSNLIGNALKYTDKPQPNIEVGYLTAEEYDIEPANSHVLYVKDDGIGIRDHHFQNIFRLFKRLHERDSYGGGTGVGLTIAKKIIEHHGGRIWVESRLGEGTTFYFMLNC